MLDRFQFSGPVHCFKILKPIPKRLIEDCLTRAETGASGRSTWIVRHAYIVNGTTQQLSCTFFRTEKLPPFLTSGTERDVHHCYALIAEIGDFLLIRKTGAKDFSDLLKGYARSLEGQVLMGALLAKNSDIEKFTAEAVDTARAKVRRQTLEGTKLQENVSTLSSSNKILNNLQHKTNDRHVSIVGNTGRYNYRGEKGGAEDFIRANLEATKKFNLPIPKHDFLNNFATVLKFADHVGKITPTEILINTPDILDYLESQPNTTPKLFYKKKRIKRYLTDSLAAYIGKIVNLLEIKKVTSVKTHIFKIKNTIDDTLVLNQDGDRYFLESEKFANIYLEFDDTDNERLMDLINRMQWFNLTFDAPQLHYAAGQLCQDNKLLGNIPGFLQIFIADPLLNSITSEKGKPKKSATGFGKDTLFGYVESKYKSSVDDLILEDLGYEYADYIGIKRNQKVQLFHCKVGNSTLSASAFQEVVGQAKKNLSFFGQIDAIPAKAKSWAKNYASTGISRIRTSDKKNIQKHIRDTLLATNVDREVHLIVNFLSLAALKIELNNLKAGKAAKKATVPLLWLLSSLRNDCLDRNVKVFIHCRP